MKRFAMTVALTCVLTGSALAGEIPSVGFTAPPPPAGTTPTSTSNATGEVPSGGLTQQISAALTLVQILLGAVV